MAPESIQQPRESSVEEERFLTALRRIMRAVDRYSKSLAKVHGVTVPQLVCLRQLERSEGLTLSELAEAVSLSPATVSGIMVRLTDHGLVERRRGSRDRRRVRAYLTAKGRRLIDKAPAPLQDSLIEQLRDLDETSRSKIVMVLEQVVDMMDASDLDAAPLVAPVTGP